MTHVRSLAIATFLLVAAGASAQSLVGGVPLQYNHAYSCHGERIIVVRCRDDSDSSYCQTVYPDRQSANGSQVAPVQMRGDVVAKLNACAQAASAPAQPQYAPPAAKSAPPRKPPPSRRCPESTRRTGG